MTDDPTPIEFPDGLEWIHTGGPLSLRGDLAGSVVLLMFWTSSNIHCLHVLQTIEYLEQRFAGRPFAVVGVHSGKYPAERGPEHVRRAVRRLGIRHPVVVDSDHATWRAFGARAWPTLCLLDGAGAVRYRGAGEPNRDRLAQAVDVLLEDARSGTGRSPSIGWPEPKPTHPEQTGGVQLRAPGGLAADPDTGVLWIADTGHHRVLGVDPLTGALRHTVGCGRPGGADGDLSIAAFHGPRGLAARSGSVWVADAGNHCLRVFDVDTHELRTVVGQGKCVHDSTGGLCGDAQGIASPRDVCVGDDCLWVAMAGVHQLWAVTTEDACASAWAGTGVAGLVDGMRHDALLAQPSGVDVHDGIVAIADSESGAVRLFDAAAESVDTLVGGGLFEFGDAVGPFERARLQHPLAVAWAEDGRALLVADTYNSSIKRLDVSVGTVETMVGAENGLLRPAALAVHGRRLFIADEDLDRVLCFDLQDRCIVPFAIVDPHPEHFEVSDTPLACRARSSINLCFPMSTPAGSYPQPDAEPRAWLRNVAGELALVDDLDVAVDREGEWGVANDIPTAGPGSGTIEVLVRSLTCEDPDGVCHRQEQYARVDLELTMDGPDVVDVPL